MFKRKQIVLTNGHTVDVPRSYTGLIWLILLVLVGLSIQITGFSFVTLFRRGYQFFVIIRMMFPPVWSYFPEVVQPMLATIAMSFIGTFAAAILAIPLAYISSSNMVKNKVILWTVRTIMSIMRTLPVLILALLLTYVFDFGTFAGTMAIFIFTLAIITKMFYELIETADMGPFEALQSSGANKVKSFTVAIFPQISGQFISTVLYNLEMNIRNAAILGYVGAGGIGLLMNEKIGWRQYDRLVIILMVLLVTVVIIESISRAIRRRIIG